MRSLTRACAVLAVLSLALAGCGKGDKPDGKEKKENKDGGDGTGGGPGKPVLPASRVDNGHPAQKAAQEAVVGLKNGEAFDTNKVSTRFLKVIGKPVKAGQPFDPFYAREWLKSAAAPLAAAAHVSPSFSGYGQPGAAVFVGSFVTQKGDGRYLIRMVEEGGAWKLDWFECSAVPNGKPAEPASLDEPFMDFAVQAAADLVAVPPAAGGAAADVLPGDIRAPLAADLFTKKLRGSAEFGVNLDKEDEQGYDYKRTMLGAKLDLVVGGKVASYTRAKTAADTYKVEFTLEGGAKKAFEVKLVGGGSPGHWQVDEFRPLPAA